MAIIKAKVTDFKSDPNNANQGTERGLKMLDNSLREFGAGRSILVDKNNTTIAGAKTLERATDIGISDALVVETDGTKLVVVKRTDLDLERDGKARRLAYADNRVGEIDLSFSPEQIADDLASGVDLSGLWYDWELDNLKAGAGEAIDPNAEWQGMPEFGNTPRAVRSLYIHFPTHENVQEFVEKLGLSITDDTKSVWYPERPENLKGQFAEDEA